MPEENKTLSQYANPANHLLRVLNLIQTIKLPANTSVLDGWTEILNHAYATENKPVDFFIQYPIIKKLPDQAYQFMELIQPDGIEYHKVWRDNLNFMFETTRQALSYIPRPGYNHQQILSSFIDWNRIRNSVKPDLISQIFLVDSLLSNNENLSFKEAPEVILELRNTLLEIITKLENEDSLSDEFKQKFTGILSMLLLAIDDYQTTDVGPILDKIYQFIGMIHMDQEYKDIHVQENKLFKESCTKLFKCFLTLNEITEKAKNTCGNFVFLANAAILFKQLL